MSLNKSLAYHGFTLKCPEVWEDITDQVEGDNVPITLAEPDEGVGALQFTAAVYEEGEFPQLDEVTIRKVLLEYAENLGLGTPIDTASINGRPATAQATFEAEGDFVVLWFLTDENSLVVATYVCEWDNRHVELPTVLEIMATVEVGDW